MCLCTRACLCVRLFVKLSVFVYVRELTHVCAYRGLQDFTPKAGTFLPFALGSRLCPGNDLAKMEVFIFLHYFLLNYTTRTFLLTLSVPNYDFV